MARAPTTDDELANLTSIELADLLKRIEAAMVERRKASRAEVKAKIQAIAAEAGFTVDELFGAKTGKAARGTAPVKYRNPDNPEETWSGRGRMAKWIAEKLKKRGNKLEDFAV